ncbi:unnamed protein product, partial [Adineta steineri]
MGQQLFKVNFQNIDSKDAQLNSLETAMDYGHEHIHFFSPIETDETTTIQHETLFIDKHRERLFQLTHSNGLQQIDAEINRILTDDVFPPIKEYYVKIIETIKLNLENQHQLNISLTNKFKQDDDENESIEDETEQVSSFAIQSLTSILLLLIKSAEKNDPTIIPQIITLTSQLCEQIPIQKSSILSNNNLLFQALQPVRDFFNELLVRNDPVMAKAVMKILLSFSIAQFSFQGILPLLARLIFDTDTTYDVRRLFIQMNKGLTASIKMHEQNIDIITTFETMNFLKPVGVYPTTQLMQLNKKLFTGQFIASVILSYIGFDHQINSNEQLNHHPEQEPFSFEFHPQTFQILFDMIKQ